MTVKYTPDHEWIQLEDHEAAVVGITLHAQDALGDVVFVDLPEVGKAVDQFATFGVVESVKAVSDLYAPVAGEVVETNDALAGGPELVNSDPYGSGWMIKVRVAPGAEPDLLDADAYDDLVAAG